MLAPYSVRIAKKERQSGEVEEQLAIPQDTPSRELPTVMLQLSADRPRHKGPAMDQLGLSYLLREVGQRHELSSRKSYGLLKLQLWLWVRVGKILLSECLLDRNQAWITLLSGNRIWPDLFNPVNQFISISS